jgi:hypothetical protein
MQAIFSQIFERVSDSLPLCYGKLALRQTGENHKLKNKIKCLRKAMKTYTWDSYKPLYFHEWRDSNGYTDEWCKSEGIGINNLFNTKTIDVPESSPKPQPLPSKITIAKLRRDDETVEKFGECPYTIEDIICSKTEKPDREIMTNLSSLMKYGANNLEHKEIGNNVIYKFFIEELMKCRRDTKGYKTIYEVMEDPSLKKAVWVETCRANSRKRDGIPNAVDVYEYHRGAKGCIAIFRPSMAKYIYKKYTATSILDPCAGWGGRLLHATWSLLIRYWLCWFRFASPRLASPRLASPRLASPRLASPRLASPRLASPRLA